MIAFVRGTVAQVGLGSAVVDVGGVGIEVLCTPATLASLRDGATATLPTSLVVREDSLTVFGFADEDEKVVFEMLQTASGVGPKLAQAMLAVHPPDALRRAVATEDVKALTAVPGIGQKGAQRIILELRDRLGAPVGGPPTASYAGAAAEPAWRVQVRVGLVGLGWSAKEADRAIDTVTADQPADQRPDQPDRAPDVAAVLRSALRALSRS
jgi:Holliday junction DNA helicase RuvA